MQIQSIKPGEAQERFNLKQYDPLGLVGFDAVALVEGDAVVQGDLTDGSAIEIFLGEDAEDRSLIIINGELRVSGEVRINESYPCLLVLGDLHCDVLHSFDNVIQVRGDAHIKYAFNGNYNHGSITVEGLAHVPYLLNSDHDSSLKPGKDTLLINYYSDNDDFFTYDYYRDELPDALVASVLNRESLDYDAFIARVKSGKSPLKKGVKPGRILVAEEIARLAAKAQKKAGGPLSLDLKEKKLLKLPAELFTIEDLEVLNLEENNFTDLPQEISRLKNLKELNLRKTGITSLPESIGELQNLESLNLNYCHSLRSLPKRIGDLKNLKRLSLWSYSGKIPDSVTRLTGLEELDIYGFYYSNPEPIEFPRWIFRLTGLKRLIVSNNSFRDLPEDILGLEKLEFLNLNSALCYVEELPDLSRLSNLKELHCDGRVTINTRPPVSQEILNHFFKITTLETLNISAFGEEEQYAPPALIKKMQDAYKDDPEKLKDFQSRLKKNKSGNYFYQRRRPMKMEDFAGLDRLVNLRDLDLAWNKLKRLPKEVLRLKKLERIRLQGNEIPKSDLAALAEQNPGIVVE